MLMRLTKFLLITLFCFSLFATPVLADSKSECSANNGYWTSLGFCTQTDRNSLDSFIAGIYRVALVLASVIAVIRFILAGLRYMTSGGSPDTIRTAKDEIWGVVLGIMLLILAAVFFNQLGLSQSTKILTG